MADEQDGYELEPIDDKPEGSSTGEGELEKESLLSGFEEDADFSDDPEVERAISGDDGKKNKDEGHDGGDEKDKAEVYIKPGWDGLKVLLIVGGVALLIAVVASGVNASDHWLAKSGLTLYNVLLHTGTGVAALGIAAFFDQKRLGQLDVAAGRMFVAVSAFAMVFRLRFLGGTGLDSTAFAFIEYPIYLLIGAGLYAAILFGLFRFDRHRFAIVAGVHFVLWILVYIGMMLNQSIGSA